MVCHGAKSILASAVDVRLYTAEKYPPKLAFPTPLRPKRYPLSIAPSSANFY